MVFFFFLVEYIITATSNLDMLTLWLLSQLEEDYNELASLNTTRHCLTSMWLCHLNVRLPWVWINRAGVTDVGMCSSCLSCDLSNCGGTESQLLQYGMVQIIVSASAM